MPVFSGFVLLLLVIRLLFPDYATFINDEPQLQEILDVHLAEGKLPLIGLTGSKQIPYGPVPLWIYGILRLFGDSHTTLFYGVGFIQLATLFGLFFLLRRWSDQATATICMFPAATAPHLIYYSRLAWDNTFLLPGALAILALVVAICTRTEDSKKYFLWGGLGVVAGICTMIHLMVLPLLASAFAVATAYEFPRSGKQWQKLVKPLALSISAALLIMIPYLIGLAHAWTGMPGSSQRWEGLPHIPEMVSRVTGFLSYYDFLNYFFAGSRAEVRDYLGWLDIFYRVDLSWVLRLPLTLALFLPVIWAWRKFREKPDKKAITEENTPFLAPALMLGSLTVGILLFLYSYQNLYRHPHYYHYVWWWPYVAAAAILLLTRERWPKLYKGMLGLLLSIGTINLCLVLTSAAYVSEHQGIRGLGFGSVVKSQRQAIHDFCSMARVSGPNTTLGTGQVVVLNISLSYFAKREHTCHGMRINYAHKGQLDLHYQDQPSGTAAFLVK